MSGQLVSARVGGKPLDPTATYRMAINNFVAAGGDGYPVVTAHPGYVDTGFVDAEVIRTYITAHSPLAVADYRARFCRDTPVTAWPAYRDAKNCKSPADSPTCWNPEASLFRI